MRFSIQLAIPESMECNVSHCILYYYLTLFDSLFMFLLYVMFYVSLCLLRIIVNFYLFVTSAVVIHIIIRQNKSYYNFIILSFSFLPSSISNFAKTKCCTTPEGRFVIVLCILDIAVFFVYFGFYLYA